MVVMVVMVIITMMVVAVRVLTTAPHPPTRGILLQPAGQVHQGLAGEARGAGETARATAAQADRTRRKRRGLSPLTA
jgi:ABC-type microcin C transport system permease subunit YejB